MPNVIHPFLRKEIAETFAAQSSSLVAGACVRIDDLLAEDLAPLTMNLRGLLPDFDIYELAKVRSSETEITTDHAIELRNRKVRPLILLISQGAAAAASSLDNSFHRIPLTTLCDQATSSLISKLSQTSISEFVRIIGRHCHSSPSSQRVPYPEGWPDWVAAVASATDDNERKAVLGTNLWRLGLVPDLEFDTLLDRLSNNIRSSRCITFPSRAATTVADRLVAAEVLDDPIRTSLDVVLSTQNKSLRFAPLWCKDLVDNHPGTLTFEKWPFSDQVASGLTELKIIPFRKQNGSVETWCKLKLEDDRLTCRIAAETTAKIVIKWETVPRRVDDVENWKIEVLPPIDLRDSTTFAIYSGTAKGDKRQYTIQTEFTSDDLAQGQQYVIRITALDAIGNAITLSSGVLAEAESDEFDIVIDDEVPLLSPRKASANSIPEAVLQAVADGLESELGDEECETERSSGVIRVRFDGRKQYQIQLSPLLVDIQHRVVNNPGVATAFSATSNMGRSIPSSSVEGTPLQLPTTLADRRKQVLSLIARDPRHNLAETVKWDEQLTAAVEEYLATYKRALDSSNVEQRRNLLLLETLSISLQTPSHHTVVQVLLPLHPLRLSWIMIHDRIFRDWSQQLLTKKTNERSRHVEMDLVRRVSADNLPFSSCDREGLPVFFAEEVSHGTGLYIPIDARSPELTIDLAFRALSIARNSPALISRGAHASNRLRLYREAHPFHSSLRILGVNPGQGDLLARLVSPLVLGNTKEDSTDDEISQESRTSQTSVLAYLDNPPFNDPLRAVHEIQEKAREVGGSGENSYLRPPLSLTIRPIDRLLSDDDQANFAVMQDVSSTSASTSLDDDHRTPVFSGLLTPTHTIKYREGPSTYWITLPALRSIPDSSPDLIGAHRSHQLAVSALLGSSGNVPAIRVTLDADQIAGLRALHARSDWVMTIDRFLGLDLFEDADVLGVGQTYILDYAPDFVEGLSERLTVTTAHRGEILRVLERAMKDLGLALVAGDSESLVLDTLTMVSGRLALRLLGNESQAREAVSLAALMKVLKDRGELDGQIIVPVDAHPEIFGVHHRNSDQGPRRCDLLLVKVSQRTFKIECIEVKSRQNAAVPSDLADRIETQLRDTENLLQDRFFGDNPARIDRSLQRTRLSALLHYYADRSCLHGLISEEQIQEVHQQIDRIEAQQKNAQISLHGYVIALDGQFGVNRATQSIPIDIITAEDLQGAGFTSSFEYQSRLSAARHSESSTARSSTDSRHGLHEPQLDSSQPRVMEPISQSETSLTPHPGDGERSSSPESQPVAPAITPTPTVEPVTPIEPEREKDRSLPSDLPPSGEVPEVVSVILGRDSSDREVSWNVSTKGSPHAFVVGIPGQGKSVTTRRIINSFAEQNLPSIVFDFHGDMAASPPANAQVIDVQADGLPFHPLEIRAASSADVNIAANELAEIIAYVCGMKEIQQNVVYRALQEIYANCGWTQSTGDRRIPTLDEFKAAVESHEAAKRVQNVGIRLTPLLDFGVFRPGATGVFDPTGAGAGLVVDVSGIQSQDAQKGATAFMLRKIYREMFQWEQTGRMKLAVVLDEAHRLAKDHTLPKLMKEGRKYGVAVVVASQGQSDFRADVIQNAGTKIIFRTNFPESKKVAGFLRGRDGADLSQSIETLKVGEAFVSTPDTTKVLRVSMYQ